jgi:hypothetical protein
MEDDPHSEVLGEVLEPVLGSCGYEDKVPGFKRMSAAIVKEDAAAAHDNVDLVLCMGSLAVRGHGQRKQHPDRAALHDGNKVRARRTGDPFLGFGKRNHAATI